MDAACMWQCTECEQENDDRTTLCTLCEASRPADHGADSDGSEEYTGKYWHTTCGVVQSIEPIPGTAGLNKLGVDIGEWNGFEPLTVVSAAVNIEVGSRVAVVCHEGWVYVGDTREVIPRQTIAGVTSYGVLASEGMLAWSKPATDRDGMLGTGVAGQGQWVDSKGRRRKEKPAARSRHGTRSEKREPVIANEAYLAKIVALLPDDPRYAPGEVVPEERPS